MSLRSYRPKFIVCPKLISFFEIFSPIEIGAITLGPVVLSKEELHERVVTHETIHFQQYIETLFFGFIILYLSFWLINLLRGMSPQEAYLNIPFEKEAYDNDHNFVYPLTRKRFCWIKMI